MILLLIAGIVFYLVGTFVPLYGKYNPKEPLWMLLYYFLMFFGSNIFADLLIEYNRYIQSWPKIIAHFVIFLFFAILSFLLKQLIKSYIAKRISGK